MAQESRNFSFTGGETTQVFEALRPQNQATALAVREAMIRKIEGVSEESLALMGIVVAKNKFQSVAKYSVVHRGEPLGHPRGVLARYIGVPETRIGFRRVGDLDRSDLLYAKIYVEEHSKVLAAQMLNEARPDELAFEPNIPQLSTTSWYPVVFVGKESQTPAFDSLSSPNQILGSAIR